MLRDARRCTESVVTKCVARARCASRRTPLERRRCDPSLTVGHLWRVIGNLTVSNSLVEQRDNENGDPSWISARIGDLLGLIRDLESEWTQDAVQRITTENTTLKQRVRQLTADNRTLDERLNAARSNLRFQDRRIADLEARLADPSATR